MFAKLLEKLGLNRSSSRTVAATRHKAQGFQLEALEDRLALSAFQVVGDTLVATGTAGADTFTFTAGTTTHRATVNGEGFNINPAVIHKVVFNGQGGWDSAYLSGNVSRDVFSLSRLQ